MEAVIIAAGQGSRLREVYSPKPLTPIFGLKLLERIILTGKNAGIRHFKIVVGYQAEKIISAIGDGTKYDVRIEYIHNPRWELGNGVSVLQAEGHVKDRFLLLMSDHIFDETMLKRLIRHGVEDDHCILCVDRNLKADYFALDDVTRVFTHGETISNIGKSLTQYNAIDTGVFLCRPVIFQALRKSTARGEYSLAAGNRILASEGKLHALDVTGHFWVDVDNREALQKAQHILIRQLFKPTDGPISRTINRRLSTWISARLAKYNISPNTITLVSFGLAICSAFLFALGGYIQVLLAGIMAQLSSVLDGCDGEIARLKLKFSTFGEWLDLILDRYADGFIIMGITISLWQTYQNVFIWIIGFATLTGTFMNSYTATIHDELLRQYDTHTPSLRLGRDVRLFIIFLGALCNELLLTLLVLLVVTNFGALRRLYSLKHVYQIDTTD